MPPHRHDAAPPGPQAAPGDTAPRTDEAACAVPALEHALAERLAQGLPLDAQSLECILRTLGVDDPARAFALLAADPDSAEHAPLLALAFSPGEETRQELEPALARARLDQATASALADRLAARCLPDAKTPLPVLLLLPEVLPGKQPLAPLPLGEALAGCVADFVRRLRPWATAPATLLRALAGRERAQADQLGALLRHGRLNWTPCREFLMATLLERAEPEDELPALAAWMLGFLDLAGEAFEPRQALAERAAVLDGLLRRAEAQDEARERASFEVLAAQGLRQGHLHAPSLRAELALCARAARLTVGGLPKEDGADGDGIAGRVQHLDLGGAEDAEALLRLLAGPVAGPVGEPGG
ncbi:hypothetical protein SAMN04488503_1908 [Humidesulfovibrio mexicanus]|uniref:Uncharacterized protein n=1 Tax=Humidesulfovibrio mexicanus TaxID=147047 RepID=A0A239AA07_9BACT|nr:hypothetical protein [Humidesulfovibrio mexicanus]SNR91864.1 hypothetical protein SAMN04488503_1908 [Humidesulfovibrio mexicanus]